MREPLLFNLMKREPLCNRIDFRLDPYMIFGLLSFLTFIFYVIFRLVINNGGGRSFVDSGPFLEMSDYYYMQHRLFDLNKH